jgi:RNA polymerase sigma-70 factor (ECF subfamily)
MAGATLPLSECGADSSGTTFEAEEPAALSDEALIRAVRHGDVRVGALLYQRLIRIIDATVTRVLGPGDYDHDDCVQAAFEEVVRSLHRGRFQQRCRLTSWAASIACHVGLNAIRSRRTERGVFDRAEDVEDPTLSRAEGDPQRALEARDELRRLRAALATLSSGRAEALLLHDAMGYGVAEVAALTDSSEAAVLSRLTRGRRDLLQRLGMVAGREEDEA